jgi:formylglycine-generating enzyme required for sulfatase activity
MTNATIHADGGSFTGDIEAETVIGRDQIIVLSGYTGADLEHVLDHLQDVLSAGRANLRAQPAAERLTVTAPDAPPLLLSAEAAEVLMGVAARRADVTAYLAALQVHPRYGRWAAQFVPLAGTLTVYERPPTLAEIPPEFTLLEVHGEGAQRHVRRRPLDDITEATAQYDTLALLGEPGSGKTTVLYKLALDAAREYLANGGGKIPLYLPLAAYRNYDTPFAFVAVRWQQLVGGDALADHLRDGRLLLLCDALNEMPFDDDRDYRARVGAWRRFIADWPGNQMLVSCRSRDYSAPLGLHQVEIARLDDARVRDFLTKYVPAQAETAWARLVDSPLLDLVRNPYYLWMLAYILAQGGVWPARPATLFRGFVHTLLAREAGRGHSDWPGGEEEGRLALETALAALAETLQPMGQGTRLPRAEVEVRVPTEVTTPKGSVAVDPATVVRLGLRATLLDTERVPDAAEHLRFYHHQLQEYFAAQALVTRFRAGEALADRWHQPRSPRAMPDPGPLGDDEPLPPPPTTGWEEPTILAAGLTSDPAAFVDAVRAVNPVLAARCIAEGHLLDLPQTVSRVQADLLRDMGNPDVHLRARIAAGEALGQVGDPRFAAVTVNGQRVLLPPLVEVSSGPFKMGSRLWHVLRLMLGGFMVAQNEVPRHTVDLPLYYIGQYPVTNAEYACFVAAGGYADEAYWRTPAARAWLYGESGPAWVEQWLETWRALQADPEKALAQLKRGGATPQQLEGFAQLAGMSEAQVRDVAMHFETERPHDRPAYWDDARYNQPTQPVVGVTWFEAAAYCAWLEEQLQAAHAPLRVWRDGGVVEVDGDFETISVRLPSEAAWEKAARGGRGRVYPWGRRWRADRANTWEGHVLRPTPVGVYPRGINVLGMHDMAGNVWEWTSSLYQPYPYDAADGRESPDAEGYRVMRGGSWLDEQRRARCASRHRLDPYYFGDLYGFRAVVSLVCSDC